MMGKRKKQGLLSKAIYDFHFNKRASEQATVWQQSLILFLSVYGLLVLGHL